MAVKEKKSSRLGSLELPKASYSFDSKGISMADVSTGESNKIIGKIELKSPFEMFKETFTSMKESLINLGNIAKKSLGLEEKENKKENITKSLGGFKDENKKGESKKGMLDVLKTQFSSLSDAFGQVSMGEKLTAALMFGALALFVQMEGTVVFIIDKLIGVFEFVRDKIFGNTENPTGNTFAAFFAVLLAFKFKGLIFAVGNALLAVTGFLGINKRVATLYRLMRLKMNTVLIPSILSALKALPGKLWGIVGKVFRGINIGSKLLLVNAQGALGALSGGMTKAFSLLGRAFIAMRVFIIGSMVPAITGMIASMMPAIIIMAPFILIGLKVALIIGTVLFGLKKAFDTFKEAIESGDDMYAVILKSVTSFFGNIIGIIPTLVKNLAAFVVGLFGADKLKAKIKNMNIGQMISDALFNLTNTFLNFIKALALGTAAAVKAIAPKGETPTEAFSRVYNEVIDGKTPNIKREKVKPENQEEDDEKKEKQTLFLTDFSKVSSTFDEKKILKSERNTKEIINSEFFKKQELENNKNVPVVAPIVTNINKQGDTYNKSDNYNSGNLNQNNTDLTDALLNVQGA